MRRRLTKIEDLFQVTGRRLIAVPGPLRTEVAGGAEIPVELRRPDGTVVHAHVNLQHFFQSPPAPPHIAAQWGCMLLGVSKDEIPVGTEVWSRDAASEEDGGGAV
jgi:hypothetical protein